MIGLLQRVASAQVNIGGNRESRIGKGLLVLLGVFKADTFDEVTRLAQKTVNLRIFDDVDGKMNRSLLDIGGEALVVSQFTLCADCRKGRRPAYTEAAPPEQAIPLYEFFVRELRQQGVSVSTGSFGASMLVTLTNDGPVTIVLDTKQLSRST